MRVLRMTPQDAARKLERAGVFPVRIKGKHTIYYSRAVGMLALPSPSRHDLNGSLRARVLRAIREG
jgi:predicted RNA binding protein YcfA (HicA-like mRNA interferase family)